MPRRRPASLAGAALHGAAELLPVSSSGHLAAARRLTGRGAPADDVALHVGPVAAMLVVYRAEAVAVLRRMDGRRLGMHAAAGALPSVAGLARGGRRRRLPVTAGLVAGAALLAAGGTRRGTRSRWEAGPRDGVWLGLAQVAALWPGVSRSGATLAAARLRGFAPREAPRLAREVGVPVTVGALAVAGRGGTRAQAAAGFAGALAAVPAARALDRGGPLTPWVLERAGLALVLLRHSRA